MQATCFDVWLCSVFMATLYIIVYKCPFNDEKLVKRLSALIPIKKLKQGIREKITNRINLIKPETIKLTINDLQDKFLYRKKNPYIAIQI